MTGVETLLPVVLVPVVLLLVVLPPVVVLEEAATVGLKIDPTVLRAFRTPLI